MHELRKLNGFEKDILLEWFLHFMPMEQRGKLMRELPQTYNKVCGRDIVEVRRVSDGLTL